MKVEQIMKLVDEYAWRAHLDSDKCLTEKARNEVIAVIEQLTKDAERYHWLRDDAYSYFWSDYAGLYPRTGLDKYIDAEMKDKESA